MIHFFPSHIFYITSPSCPSQKKTATLIESSNNKDNKKGKEEKEEDEEKEQQIERVKPEPVDWKQQEKCYFCVDGKLLKVNESGELVVETSAVQPEAELNKHVSNIQWWC